MTLTGGSALMRKDQEVDYLTMSEVDLNYCSGSCLS